MAVKDVQEKTVDALDKARMVAGDRLEVAGKAAGRRLKAARKAAAPRIDEARSATRKQLGSAREATGARLKVLGRRAGKRARSARKTIGYRIAGEKPKSRIRRIGGGLAAGAAGAAAAFFLDPVSGKRRRRVARDWTLARARTVGRRAGQIGRAAGARAYGVAQGVRQRGDQRFPPNDQVLADKVQSELFQRIDTPSGQIVVNAEDGIVVLRGQVDDAEEIRRIEQEVRSIEGVRAVENLLHVPGQPAPMHR